MSVKETCKKVLSHAFALLKDIDRGVFIRIDPVSRGITETISEPEILDDKTLSYLRGIAGRVIADGKPLLICDAQTEKDDLADTLKLLTVESVMCVPMPSDSEIVCFLYIDSLKRPYGFRFEDVALFMDVSQRVAQGIYNAWITAEESAGVADGAAARDHN
jgi:GAF domain-containing protein